MAHIRRNLADLQGYKGDTTHKAISLVGLDEALAAQDGRLKKAETKLSGIEDNANNYTHPSDGSGLASNSTEALYKIKTNASGHVVSVTAVDMAKIIGDIARSLQAQDTPYYFTINSTAAAIDGCPAKTWSGSSSDYSYTCKYSEHKRGKRADGHFYPMVKTYSLSSGNVWEETYDSPEINIVTGDITLRSTINTPNYLVLVFGRVEDVSNPTV